MTNPQARVRLKRLLVKAIAGAGLAALAGVAQAQVLDVKTGLWKKTIRMEQGGKTLLNQTLDACMTAEDLDFQQLRKKLAAPGSPCTLVANEVTTTRVKVTMKCGASTSHSTTQVKSRELVVVAATIDGGGEVTRSSEEWRFVKDADCTKDKQKQK